MVGLLPLLFFIWQKNHDVLCLTIQYFTQLFHSIECDGLVVSQITDRSGTDAVLIDERIGRNALFVHRFPQWFITDHDITHFHKIYVIIL